MIVHASPSPHRGPRVVQCRRSAPGYSRPASATAATTAPDDIASERDAPEVWDCASSSELTAPEICGARGQHD